LGRDLRQPAAPHPARAISRHDAPDLLDGAAPSALDHVQKLQMSTPSSRGSRRDGVASTASRRRRHGEQWPSHNRSSTEASTPHECRGFLCENDVASASETPTTDLCGNQISDTPRHRRDAVTGSPLWNDSLLFCPAEGSPSRCDEKLRDAVYGMPVSRISPVLWASRVLELHLRHANQSSGMAKELACTPRVNYCVW
jgi:hypothetical protein